MGNPQRQLFSVSEYEKISQDSDRRLEYRDGELIPFTDEYTTDDHNQIIQNTADLLKAHFYPSGCRVYTENVRLEVKAGEEYRLPDVMVTCSERDLQTKDVKRDPVVLVEVLSKSTAFQDLGIKAESYLTISSLKAYLIINPDTVWVRVYERDADGRWKPEISYKSLTDVITLSQVGLSLSVTGLYRFVF